MDNFFAELKRRHIYRVAAAYAVVAWVLLQLFNNLTPIMTLPVWAGTFVLVLLVGGFPIALFFAWMRELPATASSQKATITDGALIGVLVAVLAAVSYEQLAPSQLARAVQQASVEAGLGAAASPPGAISVAVLPFKNVSDDPGQEFFSDGMTDEIMTALAKVPDLRVVARASAFQFKGQNRDIQAISQAMHARYVIDGSVRKAGNRVRIAVQLIQANNGVNVWADSFDRELTDVFAIQEEIAKAIAGSLRVPLGLKPGENLVNNRTTDLASYQQYLRGKALLRARSITEAIDVLEPAVAHDPRFAPTWAILAEAYRLVPAFGPFERTGPLEKARPVVQSSLNKGEAAARESIRLDSGNAFGYAALAHTQASSGKWAAAEDLYKQAFSLDSNDPEVLNAYSDALTISGRLRDALSIRERLRGLEPFVPIYNILTAEIMQISGQSQATIPILEVIPADAAGGYLRNVLLARSYAKAGRYGEAADTLLAITGSQVSRQSVEDAARLLRTAPTKTTAPQQLPVLPGELNFVYAHIGALDRVMESSERSVELRYLTVTPNRDLWLSEFAPLRKTERFKAYARKAGLVDYWRERGWPDLCHPLGSDDFVCD